MATSGSASIALASLPLSAHYIKLPRAVYIWVGVAGTAPSLASLCTAVPGDAASAAPSAAASLLGGSAEAEDLAARLSRRTGRMVLLSFDGIDGAADELAEVEAQLFRLIK